MSKKPPVEKALFRNSPPRVWKTLFADDPLRSDLDRAREPPTR